MKFLREYFYGGIDWHDSYSNTTTMYYNGEICTKEEEFIPAIADEFFKNMEKWFPITKTEFIEKLKKVRETKEKIKIPLYEELEDGTMKINSFDYEEEVVYSNELNIYIDKNDFLTIEQVAWNGQATFYSHYEIVTIEDEDIAYMVCESFHCPTKGVPVVERIYRELFDNLKDAEEYRKELDKDIEIRLKANPYPISESTLNIINRKKIEATEFYQLNMEANALMKDKNTNPLADNFHIFVKGHIESLQK